VVEIALQRASFWGIIAGGVAEKGGEVLSTAAAVMGCVDSKPLEAFEGWWKVSVAGVNDNPVSKVGIRSRELSAYDFAAEGLNDVDASPSVLGRPAQFVRPQSLYLGGREDAGGVMDKATPRVRRALNVPAQFHTIQDALNASNDGDVIRISEGRCVLLPSLSS